MRIVFFGTPAWAVPSLEALLRSDHEVTAVVANPDRPAGRGYEMQAPPVKRAAEAAGVEVAQPPKARDPQVRAWLQGQKPDVAVVVAYGKILPPELLEVPPHGFVNVHFSLLPAYRGAAPVQRALLDGLEVTGVTIIRLTEGMDEGPIIAAREIGIGSQETAGELGERLAVQGAELLVQSLAPYAEGELLPREQDHEQATYAPKIGSKEARIDWTAPAAAVRNKVRALNPAPGAWTTLEGSRLKVHRAEVIDAALSAPGALQVDERERLLAGTGDRGLMLSEVQPAGKRRMTGAELAHGLRVSDEARLV